MRPQSRFASRHSLLGKVVCVAMEIRVTTRSQPSPRARPWRPGRLTVVVLPILLILALSVGACGGSGGVTSGGSAMPTPGATLKGPVEISGKASSASITLMVSPDGASVSFVGVTLNDLKTESFSAGSMTKQVTGAIPISKGSFTGQVSGVGAITGTFTSATEANGTAKLTLEIPYAGSVDLGEFKWTASAQ